MCYIDEADGIVCMMMLGIRIRLVASSRTLNTCECNTEWFVMNQSVPFFFKYKQATPYYNKGDSQERGSPFLFMTFCYSFDRKESIAFFTEPCIKSKDWALL